MSDDTASILVHALMTSRLDNGNALLYGISNTLLDKAKKKYFVSNLARIFQTDAACSFLFFILFFFYFNWPLPPRTSETKNDRKVSTSVFSDIKQDFTRFLSSHVLKFFQNSKLSSFFVVKMKKKNYFKKKNESLNFAKSNAHRKTNADGSFETQNFFFSLISSKHKMQLLVYFQKLVNL